MKLPKLISDGMVLQHGKKIDIWGKTWPNQSVVVSIDGKTYKAYGDTNGDFNVVIEELKAGGPYEMELNDGESLIIRNIMAGDVWVLGGQSNMELPIRRTLDLYEKEIKHAYEDRIRMFAVPMTYEFQGVRDEIEHGYWRNVTPEQVLDFSAVGYFFAEELLNTYNIPIGLIQTAVGGTPIEAWLSEEALKNIGGYEKIIEQCKDESYIEETKVKEAKENDAWFQLLQEKDPGIMYSWHTLDTIPKDWLSVTLPSYFNQESMKDYYGSIWLKKEFVISNRQWEKDTKLVLGTLVDADETYVNGVLVGSTGYLYPPRRYHIPKGILKNGTNTITVRLIATHNRPGFVPDMPYYLLAGEEKTSLDGEWKYQLGTQMNELPRTTFFQYKPAGVYNGILYPIHKYKIKGLAFYQGESNTRNPIGYEKLFCAYIEGVRSLFKEEELPVVYVQLANYVDGEESINANHWAELREEQRKALKVRKTAMVVTIDIGEYNELHPQNKKEVGKRMSLAARGIAYGETITYSGPLFHYLECVENYIVLHFTFADEGFCKDCYEQNINGFEISFDGYTFHKAKAYANGNCIYVHYIGDEMPTFLRYAWRDCPENLNLYNKEGLPASPFITTIYCGEK